MNEVEKAIKDNFPNYKSIGVDLAKEKDKTILNNVECFFCDFNLGSIIYEGVGVILTCPECNNVFKIITTDDKKNNKILIKIDKGLKEDNNENIK